MQRYHTLICKPGTHVKDGIEHPGDPMSELADRCSAFIIEEGYPWS